MFSNQTCICHLCHFSEGNFLHISSPITQKMFGHQPGVDKNRFRRKDVGDVRRQHPRTSFSLDNGVERADELGNCACMSLVDLFPNGKLVGVFFPPLFIGAKYQLRSEDENSSSGFSLRQYNCLRIISENNGDWTNKLEGLGPVMVLDAKRAFLCVFVRMCALERVCVCVSASCLCFGS